MHPRSPQCQDFIQSIQLSYSKILKIPHLNEYQVKKIKGILFIYAFTESVTILQATTKIFRL